MRVIELAQLELEDWETSKPCARLVARSRCAASRARALNRAVAHARAPDRARRPFEEGDAVVFVSHSWSDCPRDKFTALRKWGIAFEATHGRRPVVW
jgi:methyl coenzyme M reductase subunit C-like uncharacterized protein (methanogenesis marker protein 7)